MDGFWRHLSFEIQYVLFIVSASRSEAIIIERKMNISRYRVQTEIELL